MYRKYINKLLIWNNSRDRKPLMVWGARQVGKTYLIKELFAKQQYHEKFIYIDCLLEKEFVQFCSDIVDPNKIITYIENWKHVKIDSSTLIIFDEVQECLSLVTALKYFWQNYPRVPVITTGSMVRIKIYRHTHTRGAHNKFLFPIGCIDEINIYPLNFGEYLFNRNKTLYDSIVNCFENKTTVPDHIHNLALQIFNEYLIIGGMPEVVNEYLLNNNYLLCQNKIKVLYENYLNDMELYQASAESIIRTKKIYKTIYEQIAKPNKNFKTTLVEHHLRHRDLNQPINWLLESRIVLQSHQINDHVKIPLNSEESSLYRLYLSDLGMFCYQSNVNTNIILEDNKTNTLSGIFYENYVAIELNNYGVPLYYWTSQRNAEFEFIVHDGMYTIPIDVKKTRGKLGSLNKFKEHNKFKYAIKLSQNNYGYDLNTKIITYPIYMTFLVVEKLAKKEDLI